MEQMVTKMEQGKKIVTVGNGLREILRDIVHNCMYYKEPTKGCQKIFLLQNSLNKLGNKSMGNLQVKPVTFPNLN